MICDDGCVHTQMTLYMHATSCSHSHLRKAVIKENEDSRLRLHPGVQLFIAEQNVVGISAVMFVVFHRHLGIYTTRHTATICDNMTSSTKPEVHNIATPTKSTTSCCADR